MLYPECPKVIKELKPAQALPKVFKKWIHDDMDRENKAYNFDTSPFLFAKKNQNTQRDNFEPNRFMKDTEDINYCENLLLKNFKFL